MKAHMKALLKMCPHAPSKLSWRGITEYSRYWGVSLKIKILTDSGSKAAGVCFCFKTV